MKKIIVGYARESTKRQAVEGFNLDDQVRKIKNYVEIYYGNDEYELEIVREEGASAKNLDRPEFTKILNRIRRGKIDVLVIYTYDRLCRRLKDFIYLLELMEEKGIILDSMMEKFDTSTASGRFMAHQIVAMAEWEEDTISERTKRGLLESARQGNYVRANVPFGYRRVVNGKIRKLKVDPDESKTVYWIFDQVANHDRSANSVCNQLKFEKRHGREWDDATIYRILRRKIYYGTLEIDGEEIENHSPSIVDKEMWLKANRLSTYKRAKQNKYIYKGYVKCEKCKTYMSCSVTYKDKKRYLYYTCKTCKRRISEHDISEIFVEQIDQKIKEDIWHDDLVTFSNVSKTYLKKINHLKMDLEEKFISEEFAEAEITANEDKIKEKQKKLEDKFKKTKYLSFGKVSFSDKRALLLAYVKEIKVSLGNKYVTITWKN